MKTIDYRGGVLRFRIPATWAEDYDDREGAMFYEDVPDSGTLRVKVITIRAPGDRIDSATALLGSLRVTGTNRSDTVVLGGNAYLRFEEVAFERGTKIKTFYWLFANPIPPVDARIVTFSYTVLEALAETEPVRREIAMLHEEIVKTEFADRIGKAS